MLRIAIFISLFASPLYSQDDAGQLGTSTPQYQGMLAPLSWKTDRNSIMYAYCGWYVAPNLFVTCKHNCDQNVGDTVTTSNNGKSTLKYLTDEGDGYAVWEFSPPVDKKFVLKLANNDPVRGQEIYHVGLPGLKIPVYVKGEVVGPITLYDDEGKAESNCMESRANFCRGYSGGPAIDSRGYVVGMSTHSNKEINTAAFFPVSKLKLALTSFQSETYSNRPFIDVWVSGDFYCGACEKFLDYARTTGPNRGFDYHVHKLTAAQCASKGLAVPMFTVGDEPYKGPLEWPLVDEWARGKLGVKDAQMLPQKEPPHAEPIPQAAPQLPSGMTASPEALMILAQALEPEKKSAKAADPVVSWDGIKIILVVSDSIPGIAEIMNGPGRRSIERLTHGKAHIYVIAESERPTKYADYEKTLGVKVDKFHVSVLIPEINKDADFIIRQVELMLNANISNSITEKIADIPVEPIFQSISSPDYQSVTELIDNLGVVEEKSSFSLLDPKVIGPVGALLALLYAKFPRKKKLVEAVVVASQEVATAEKSSVVPATKPVVKKKVTTKKKATTK
jgi:hypothetical protein